MATPKKATKTTSAAKQVENASLQRTAAAWRKRASAEFELDCPSGNKALVRRPGPGMFLKGGAIPDSLAPLVNEAVRDKQGLPPEKLAAAAADPNMVAKMIGLIDSALLSIVIEPALREDPKCIRPTPQEYSRYKNVPHDHMEGVEVCDEPAWDEIHLDKKLGNHHLFIPGDAISEEEREGSEEDFMYLSEVDLNDKMFIFNFAAGGSSDLERFRTEHTELVDSLHAVDNSPK